MRIGEYEDEEVVSPDEWEMPAWPEEAPEFEPTEVPERIPVPV